MKLPKEYREGTIQKLLFEEKMKKAYAMEESLANTIFQTENEKVFCQCNGEPTLKTLRVKPGCTEKDILDAFNAVLKEARAFRDEKAKVLIDGDKT